MFRINQKVVCVDAGQSAYGLPVRLKRGAIYTVTGIVDRGGNNCGLYLAETTGIHDLRHHPAFRATRFRPAVERKTDISIFQEILRKATRKQRARA